MEGMVKKVIGGRKRKGSTSVPRQVPSNFSAVVAPMTPGNNSVKISENRKVPESGTSPSQAQAGNCIDPRAAVYIVTRREFLVAVLTLSDANSAANPIIYAVFSHNFRHLFRRLLCAACVRPQPDLSHSQTLHAVTTPV